MTDQERKDAKKAIRTWAREQPGIGMSEAYVLEQMAFLADPAAGNTCFPSAAWVAARCRIRSEKNVRLIWARLEGHGLISGAAQPGRATVWTLNLGVTVAAPSRVAGGSRKRTSASAGSGKPTPVEPRSKRPASPVTVTGVEPRSLQPPTPVTATGDPGQIDRPPPVGVTDEGYLRVSKGSGREGSGSVRRKPVFLEELPNGERRTARRSRTAMVFRVRDDTFDAGGNRSMAVGDFALTESHLWQFARDFPALNADPATGIEWVLKLAEDWCLRAEVRDPEMLRPRNDLVPWLPRRFLAEHNSKSARRNSRQQQRLSEVG